MTWHRRRRKRLGKRGEVRPKKTTVYSRRKTNHGKCTFLETFTIIIITTAIITLTTILIVQIIIIKN